MEILRLEGLERGGDLVGCQGRTNLVDLLDELEEVAHFGHVLGPVLLVELDDDA